MHNFSYVIFRTFCFAELEEKVLPSFWQLATITYSDSRLTSNKMALHCTELLLFAVNIGCEISHTLMRLLCFACSENDILFTLPITAEVAEITEFSRQRINMLAAWLI